MSFNFAKLKAVTRRVVHRTLGVPAFYLDSSLSIPVVITARCHSRIDRMGDLDGQSYAEVVEGIDRVIFEAAEARINDVKRGGMITFEDIGAGLGVSLGSILGGSGIGAEAFILQVREPSDGPYTETWSVTRKATNQAPS